MAYKEERCFFKWKLGIPHTDVEGLKSWLKWMKVFTEVKNAALCPSKLGSLKIEVFSLIS